MKKLKICFLGLISLIVLFSIFITIELIRFNNNLYIKPLIVIGPIETSVKAGSNIHQEKMHGIGYTIQYEYLAERKENSDYQNNRLISGTFKLFGGFFISSWIE